MTRAEALEQAIDDSEPGDEIYLHNEDCTMYDSLDTDCSCEPKLIVIGGGYRLPIGFRKR